MSLELKIKSKHLTEEAKIIRFEEYKLRRQAQYLREYQREDEADNILSKWSSLNMHRRKDVRNENRATYLARAFLAGKAYSEVEQKRSPEMEYEFQTRVIPRVCSMVSKYGNGPILTLTALDTAKTIRDWTAIQ